jgi:N-methylhydantoinase A/oxoprolinase/acetone carboxylase beta subunit
MKPSADVGGTFTDLAIQDAEGRLSMYKTVTTFEDPVAGVLNVLQTAADERGSSRRELLSQCSIFIHATTRATNAILTGETARTAFLTTKGHPDILLLREGGRTEPFNYRVPDPRGSRNRLPRAFFEIAQPNLDRFHSDPSPVTAINAAWPLWHLHEWYFWRITGNWGRTGQHLEKDS